MTTAEDHQCSVGHADFDAFYASVEERDCPDYRDRPVVVGALPGHRGVAAAANYRARAFGIHSAMPIAEAYRRCPDAVYLRPDMAKYAEVSRQIFRVLGTLAPVVEHVSVDEAYQRPVSVTVVHPMPPIAPRYHRACNQQLRIAARESEPARRAGVLLGDLNATPCSSGLAGLADEGFRRATGLSPTWPAILGGLLGIPIDQVLVTPHWSVTTSGSGPRIGSDHFPVWARLSLSADEPGAVRR